MRSHYFAIAYIEKSDAKTQSLQIPRLNFVARPEIEAMFWHIIDSFFYISPVPRKAARGLSFVVKSPIIDSRVRLCTSLAFGTSLY
jgi:hypothetical protein